LDWKIARDIYDTKDAKDLEYIALGLKSQIGKDANDKDVAWGPQDPTE